MSGMRLLDLVEQHDAVGMRAHGVHEQAALLEADVAGRRADQPRHRVLLHVLAHVEADELVAEEERELLGQLRLADAGRPGEQEAAGRPLRLAQARARSLDRLRDQMHGLLLAEDDALRAIPRASAAARDRTTTPGAPECAPSARRRLRYRRRRSDRFGVPGCSRLRSSGFAVARFASRDAAARPRRLRRSRRSRCRAACSRAGAGRRAWRRPRAPRPCTSRWWCSS